MYLLRLHSWRSTMFWLALRLPMPGHCLRSDILYSTTGFVNIVQSPSRVQLIVTPWTAASQASLSITISWSLPKFMSIESVMPFSHLILWHPLFCTQSFPALGTYPVGQLFADDWNTGASVSILPMSIQGWFPLRLTDLLSLLSKDSQESSLAPQLKGINSLVLCLLYGPALTTVCDHWEDHSLDYTDLCQQSFVSALHEKWHKSSGFRVFMENISKAAALPHARCGFLWQQES